MNLNTEKTYSFSEILGLIILIGFTILFIRGEVPVNDKNISGAGTPAHIWESLCRADKAAFVSSEIIKSAQDVRYGISSVMSESTDNKRTNISSMGIIKVTDMWINTAKDPVAVNMISKRVESFAGLTSTIQEAVFASFLDYLNQQQVSAQTQNHPNPIE